MAKHVTFFANFPVNKHPSTSEVINRYRSTCEGCVLVPLVTSSIGGSELIIHFQEAYARLFPNCYNKQGIQSNLPSYTPMNQGTICAKVYPEGIQPIKGNNCGLIPSGSSMSETDEEESKPKLCDSGGGNTLFRHLQQTEKKSNYLVV